MPTTSEDVAALALNNEAEINLKLDAYQKAFAENFLLVVQILKKITAKSLHR